MSIPARDSSVTKCIADDNIACLQQGAELVDGLDSAHFTRTFSHCFNSSIGEHFRHILDHYQCLIDGLDTRVNDQVMVDYDRRRRDAATEQDANRTMGWIEQICSFLETISEIEVERLAVKMDSGSSTDNQWLVSTLPRELQFLLSHTVHHYALIATMNAVAGVETPADFGIAPSTLAHRRKTSC